MPIIFEDFYNSFTKYSSWAYLGIKDIQARYRRTTMGPLWMMLTTLITIVGMGIVGSALFKSSIMQMFPYVTAGIVTWIFLCNLINEGTQVYISQAGTIKNIQTSLLSYCLRLFVRNLIQFFQNFIVLSLVFFVFRYGVGLKFLWIIPIILIYFINSICFSIIFGFLSTRFRDIPQFISSILSILAFLTPIMWRTEMLGGKAQIVFFNPLFHFFRIMRDALLSESLDSVSLNIVIIITISNIILTSLFYEKYKKRLAFWL